MMHSDEPKGPLELPAAHLLALVGLAAAGCVVLSSPQFAGEDTHLTHPASRPAEYRCGRRSRVLGLCAASSIATWESSSVQGAQAFWR